VALGDVASLYADSFVRYSLSNRNERQKRERDMLRGATYPSGGQFPPDDGAAPVHREHLPRQAIGPKKGATNTTALLAFR
jgi:hypothetical protein